MNNTCGNNESVHAWPGLPYYPHHVSKTFETDPTYEYEDGPWMTHRTRIHRRRDNWYHLPLLNNQTFVLPAPPGPPHGIVAGYYKLCWARRSPEANPENVSGTEFVVEIGDFRIAGPRAKHHGCTLGVPCTLPMEGVWIPNTSHVLLIEGKSHCGPEAEPVWWARPRIHARPPPDGARGARARVGVVRPRPTSGAHT